MAALVPIELEITRERITDSVANCRATGKDLSGRRQTFTDSQTRNAVRLIEGGELTPRSPGTWGRAGDPLPADPRTACPKHPCGAPSWGG